MENVESLPAIPALTPWTGDRGVIDQALALTDLSDDKDFVFAGEVLLGLKQLRRSIESHYKTILDPINASANTVRRMRDRDLGPAQDAEVVLNSRWSKEDQRRKDEAQRLLAEATAKAEAEARARQAEEAASLTAAAENEADPILALSLRAEAATVKAAAPVAVLPVEVASMGRPAVRGLSSRRSPRAEVTDLMELVKAVAKGKVPLEALQANEVWLNTQAKQTNGRMTYPGVTVTWKTIATGRG